MKYLITGITGFAGPHLANLLVSQGHEVFGLIRQSNGMETDILDVVPETNFRRIRFVYGDLRDLRLLTKIISINKFDGVFHLAAQSHPPTSFEDPIGTFQDNIIGTANLIQVIADSNPETKLMFCSTSEVYGNIGIDKRKITTEDTILPANPYGVSKAAIDIYMQERMTNGKIKGFITRAFSHTGPRRGRTFSISSDAYQIILILRKEQKNLRVGNLTTTRVVMDVRDTVNAYSILMQNDISTGKIFNVCGNTPRTMQFFTNKMLELKNLTGVEQVIDPALYRKNDIYYQHGDCKALTDLGWKEAYTINRTLEDLLNYWDNKI